MNFAQQYVLFAFPEAGKCNDCIFYRRQHFQILNLSMLDTNVVNPSFGGFIPPIFGEFWDGLSLITELTTFFCLGFAVGKAYITSMFLCNGAVKIFKSPFQEL